MRKKKNFVAPAIRVVKMHSESTIMASSQEPNTTTERMTEGGSINWEATDEQ